MTESAVSGNGWGFVAEHEGMAPLLGAIVHLDATDSHTRSELADAAGIPLKDLYLSGTLSALTDIGLLERVDDGGEATYVIDDESPVYERVVDFETALSETV